MLRRLITAVLCAALAAPSCKTRVNKRLPTAASAPQASAILPRTHTPDDSSAERVGPLEPQVLDRVRTVVILDDRPGLHLADDVVEPALIMMITVALVPVALGARGVWQDSKAAHAGLSPLDRFSNYLQQKVAPHAYRYLPTAPNARVRFRGSDVDVDLPTNLGRQDVATFSGIRLNRVGQLSDVHFEGPVGLLVVRTDFDFGGGALAGGLPGSVVRDHIRYRPLGRGGGLMVMEAVDMRPQKLSAAVESDLGLFNAGAMDIFLPPFPMVGTRAAYEAQQRAVLRVQEIMGNIEMPKVPKKAPTTPQPKALNKGKKQVEAAKSAPVPDTKHVAAQQLKRSILKQPGVEAVEVKGAGTYGVVLTVKFDGDLPPVAVKVQLEGYRQNSTGGHSVVSAIRKEVRAHMQFAHNPGVVKLYGAMRKGTTVITVMEPLRGTWRSEEGLFASMTPHQTTTAIIQGADTLAAFHARNVQWGDGKPANLLLDAKGNARVADLGFAEEVTSGRATTGTYSPGVRGMGDEIIPAQRNSAEEYLDDDIFTYGMSILEARLGRNIWGDIHSSKRALSRKDDTTLIADAPGLIDSLRERFGHRMHADEWDLVEQMMTVPPGVKMSQVSTRLRDIHGRWDL